MSSSDAESVTVRQSGEIDTTLVCVPAAGVALIAVERALIVFALESNGGNRTRSAKFLRLTRSALLYRMQKFGLNERRDHDDGTDDGVPLPS